MATEELFVNVFDDDKLDWEEIGASPYLNDSSLNYIRTTVLNAEEGDFDFADSGVGAGTINSVKLALQGYRELTNAFGFATLTVYIYDGSSWQSGGTMGCPTSTAWFEKDISAIIDSWAKVDACRLYIKLTSVLNARAIVFRAKLVIDYTPVVPPAKPLINKPLINPILVNVPIIR